MRKPAPPVLHAVLKWASHRCWCTDFVRRHGGSSSVALCLFVGVRFGSFAALRGQDAHPKPPRWRKTMHQESGDRSRAQRHNTHGESGKNTVTQVCASRNGGFMHQDPGVSRRKKSGARKRSRKVAQESAHRHTAHIVNQDMCLTLPGRAKYPECVALWGLPSGSPRREPQASAAQ